MKIVDCVRNFNRYDKRLKKCSENIIFHMKYDTIHF